MVIKVLGPGCPNCQKLEELTKKAVMESGTHAEICKVSDINEIISSGIIRTPGLIINNVIKSQGKIPDSSEIARWIREAVQEQ